MSLLTFEERQRLIKALIDAGLDVAGTRRVLLGSVDRRLLGIMAVSPLPAVQLSGDITYLDKAGRLATGEVPLEIYLSELLPLLAGDPAAERVVKALLNLVTSRAGGGPNIDLSPAKVPELKEKLIHGTDDTVSYAFMLAGVTAGASVMKLFVPRYQGGVAQETKEGPWLYLGTGWVLAPDFIITNHHVINARDDGEPNAGDSDLHLQGRGARLLLDFDSDAQTGSEVVGAELVAWNVDLDYAVLAVGLAGRPPLARAGKLVPGTKPTPVNIVQHPRGRSKRYGIRNNLVSGGTDTDLRYFTDTEFGSSGSPVCNDKWEVVALHRGATYVEDVQFQGKPTAYVNVGTHLDVILKDIGDRFPEIAQRL